MESRSRKSAGTQSPDRRGQPLPFQKRGKRLRPALLILGSRLCGYRGQEHVFWSALVEIIHTASLIHDDIVDNSPLRRGRDTVHAKWGPNITVLLGDFLYIQSIALALKTKNHAIIDILADVTAQMVEGELIEYSQSGNPGLTEDAYLEILDKKTARLFSASCQIGGVLAGVSPKEQAAEGIRPEPGLVFPDHRRSAGFTGDEATLGKPVLSDLREGRITLPLIYALRRSNGDLRDELVRLIKKSGSEPEGVKQILDRVAARARSTKSSSGPQTVRQKAKDVLSAFPESQPRDSLARMADLILQRKKWRARDRSQSSRLRPGPVRAPDSQAGRRRQGETSRNERPLRFPKSRSFRQAPSPAAADAGKKPILTFKGDAPEIPEVQDS